MATDTKKAKEKEKKAAPEKGNAGKKERKEPDRAASGGLLSAGDIGKIAGVPSNTVQHWKYRDPSFPKPVDSPTSGDLYRRGAVMAWLRKTGRAK